MPRSPKYPPTFRVVTWSNRSPADRRRRPERTSLERDPGPDVVARRVLDRDSFFAHRRPVAGSVNLLGLEGLEADPSVQIDPAANRGLPRRARARGPEPVVPGTHVRRPALRGDAGLRDAVGDQAGGAEEPVDPPAVERAEWVAVVAQGEAMGVLDGVDGLAEGPLGRRLADVPAEVALPAGGEATRPRLLVGLHPEPGITEGRSRDGPDRAAVVVPVAVTPLDEKPAVPETSSHLGQHHPLGRSRPQRGVDAARPATSVRCLASPSVNHAAEGVRAPGHGPGASRDLHRLQRRGVQERGAGTGPAFGRHARPVDEHQRATTGQATERRRRGQTFPNAPRPRDAGDRVRQGRGPALRDVLPEQERGRVGGWGLGVRARPCLDRHRVRGRQLNGEDERRAVGGQRLDEEGRGVDLAREDDEHLKRWSRLRDPREAAVRPGAGPPGLSEEEHPGIGRGLAVREMDDGLEGPRWLGKSEDRGQREPPRADLPGVHHPISEPIRRPRDRQVLPQQRHADPVPAGSHPPGPRTAPPRARGAQGARSAGTLGRASASSRGSSALPRSNRPPTRRGHFINAGGLHAPLRGPRERLGPRRP